MKKIRMSILILLLGGSLFLISGCGADKKDDIESLKATVNAFQKELTRMQDIEEIQRLMARYEAIHNETDMGKTYMLFADREDSSFTVTADHIIGYDNIKSYFERMTGGTAREGTMFEHPLSTPNIVVAEDGQTAKATWGSMGHETMGGMGGGGAPPGGSPPGGAMGSAPGGSAPAGGSSRGAMGGMPSDAAMGSPPSGSFDGMPGGSAPSGGDSGSGSSSKLDAMWCYGKYANDFIKIDGKWYIWHLQWIRFFRMSFDTSWVDQTMEESYGQFYQNGEIVEKEGSYFRPYYTTWIGNSIPASPKPYKTWTKEDENGGWWKHETIDEP